MKNEWEEYEKHSGNVVDKRKLPQEKNAQVPAKLSGGGHNGSHPTEVALAFGYFPVHHFLTFSCHVGFQL